MRPPHVLITLHHKFSCRNVSKGRAREGKMRTCKPFQFRQAGDRVLDKKYRLQFVPINRDRRAIDIHRQLIEAHLREEEGTRGPFRTAVRNPHLVTTRALPNHPITFPYSTVEQFFHGWHTNSTRCLMQSDSSVRWFPISSSKRGKIHSWQIATTEGEKYVHIAASSRWYWGQEMQRNTQVHFCSWVTLSIDKYLQSYSYYLQIKIIKKIPTEKGGIIKYRMLSLHVNECIVKHGRNVGQWEDADPQNYWKSDKWVRRDDASEMHQHEGGARISYTCCIFMYHQTLPSLPHIITRTRISPSRTSSWTVTLINDNLTSLPTAYGLLFKDKLQKGGQTASVWLGLIDWSMGSYLSQASTVLRVYPE